ncbi:hypothetical protein ACHAWO_006277 [Cyclotella atomus]|uniref:Uncharacterized protein n=1 Tax=Cyclotella atomus TaxID=382360 RepID=A0ABD3Q053_9STRA
MSTAIHQSSAGFSPSTIHTTTNNASSSQLITYTSSSPTVDYDTNVTPLYAAIGNSDWDAATSICESILQKLNNGTVNNNDVINEAATWVVRKKANGEILWRFLPIHSTCALSPPHSFLRLLIKLHPSSVKTVDHQGLLPIHYACGSQSSREVVYTLLMSFPQGALCGDPRGMIPLHYLGQWGPNVNGGSSGGSGIVEMMCVASGEMVNAKDNDGNTPLKLAQNATYPSHNEVAQQIANHIMRKGLHLTNSINSNPASGGKYVNASTQKMMRYNSPLSSKNYNGYSSFDELTMDSNMVGLDKSDRITTNNSTTAVDPPAVGRVGLSNVRHGHAPAMVSFGDLLEDEEREENAVGDQSREVRESIEISLGGGRTPSGSSVWNKLGISPVNNPNKSKLTQHMSNNKEMSNQSNDNRSILSDPLLGNSRIASSPRRIDQVQHGSANYTDPTPKTAHRRTFSWNVDPSSSNATDTTSSIIDKYTSPRHSRDPTARGLPPMSPRFVLHTEHDKETREAVDPSPSVSRDEYEKLKNAKEISDGQLRMLKLEKEQVDIVRKNDFVENNKRIQSDFQERLEKEAKEKEALEEREKKLSKELDEARKRIAELESQLSEVETFGKNAAETFGKDASKQKEIITELERQMKVLKEKVSSNDTSLAQLEEEKKKCAALEAQVDELKTKIDAMQRTHGEAVYQHLQEVRSLRTSLERATEDIEKSKSLTLELNAKEKQHKEELAAKENEWKERYAKLEAHMMAKDKIEAQFGSSTSQFGSASSGLAFEERSKLEMQMRSLTEASWSAQNAEYAIKAELAKKESAWREERSKLEAEVKHLKDIVKESGADGFSITSSLVRANHSFGDNNMDMTMQLDSAMREAEEMRKFNTTIRKEHEQTIEEMESELEKERNSKKELMSEIVTLQFKVSRLESELEERGDGGVEVSLYGARKSRGSSNPSGSGSMDDMELARRAIDVVRKESDGRERLLRVQLDQANRQIKTLENELYEKSGSSYLNRQLNEARGRISQLEDSERNLKKDLDEGGNNREELDRQEKCHREEISRMEAKIKQLEKKEQMLKTELADLESFNAGGISSDDRHLYQQLRSVKNQLADLQDREDGYLREIRELKKQISELESNDHGLDAKLMEAQRSQRWALQEKEDEMNAKIRDVKKEYENMIIENQNKHLKELRDVKRELTSAFREKEDSYMQQLRNAKRREQALQDREDDLVKQMADVQLKSSLDDLDIDGILRKKDDEFVRLLEESAAEKTAKIEELSAKVESLEEELRVAGDAGAIKEELSELKKELEKQRRKHKSEMNKLQNTLDLQKSKEARLQSHIKSMESQITGMVSDYEARLEEAYYATAAVKGALK